MPDDHYPSKASTRAALNKARQRGYDIRDDDGFESFSMERDRRYDIRDDDGFEGFSFEALPSPSPRRKRNLDDDVYETEYASVAARPPRPTDDDSKVARFEEQAKRDLEKTITGMGEAGWRSQYYVKTWSPEGLNTQQSNDYYVWQIARDGWTRTGDEKYLDTLRSAVDFTIPPDADAPHHQIVSEHQIAVSERAKRRQRIGRAVKRGMLAVSVTYVAAILLVILISIL